MIERRILQSEKAGKPIVSLLRTPDAALRDDVTCLIKESFAPGMAPLIEAALTAAHQSPMLGDMETKQANSPYVFADDERGAYADLSTCRLWTRAFNSERGGGAKYLHGIRHGPVVS